MSVFAEPGRPLVSCLVARKLSKRVCSAFANTEAFEKKASLRWFLSTCQCWYCVAPVLCCALFMRWVFGVPCTRCSSGVALGVSRSCAEVSYGACIASCEWRASLDLLLGTRMEVYGTVWVFLKVRRPQVCGCSFGFPVKTSQTGVICLEAHQFATEMGRGCLSLGC